MNNLYRAVICFKIEHVNMNIVILLEEDEIKLNVFEMFFFRRKP